MIKSMRAAIFDLDGVIVDTAKYHYLAWKKLARQYGFDFSETDNERLKGVSRQQSLEILLEIGDLQVAEVKKQQMAAQKNAWYVDYVRKMPADAILPGAAEYLRFLREQGVKTALGSASQNAVLILDRLHIAALFDVIVDGACVQRTKPDPEVFVRAAAEVGIEPQDCVVFEDAATGIEAAQRAGMGSVGVGRPEVLKQADMVIASLDQLLTLALVDKRI